MKMNQKWLMGLALAVCLATTFTSLRADDDDHDHDHDGPPPGSHAQRNGDSGPVSLEHEMGAMGRDFKTIRRQVSDSTKNPSTLAAVLDLEQHTLAAKTATLHAATTMPTDETKKAKQNDYQADMVTLLRHELDLEETLLANQNDKATKIVAELHDLEDQGHKEFRSRRHD